MTRYILPLLGGAACLFLQGCRCCHQPNNCVPVAPPPSSQIAPVAPVPQGNGFAPINPAAPQPIPQNPPAPVFPEVRQYQSSPGLVQPQWRAPADGQMQYIVPNNGSPLPPRDAARLQAPDLGTQPAQKTTEPPQQPSSPALPTIAGFAVAKGQAASGRKPGLDEINWLRANNYKAVLHIRVAGQDDSADQRMFQGFGYASVEVSPQSLRPAVDEFNKYVVQSASQPLFVYYDQDPMLAGALWYLHFRAVDRLSEQEARQKATPLGLTEDQTEANKLMWTAIQKYLSEQAPPK